MCVVLAIGAVQADASARISLTMRGIFDDLQFLLPLSFDDEWLQGDRTTPVSRALQSLADNASAVAAHAGSDQHHLRFLGRNLAHELRGVLQHYRRSEFESARQRLLRATDYCVACHTRLPAVGDSPRPLEFLNDTLLGQLSAEKRVYLELATRRYQQALASFELLLAKEPRQQGRVAGLLTDYLIVAIRVTGDIERALTTLRSLANRATPDTDRRAVLEHWIAELQELRGVAGPPTMALATELVQRGTRHNRFLLDQRGLIAYVVASAVLYQLIDSGLRDRELAHAYYLLGLVEFRIARPFWVAQGEMFLETSIRLAPGEATAVDAYDLLRSEIEAGYTGSSGTSIPDDVAFRLDALQELIEAWQSSPPPI